MIHEPPVVVLRFHVRFVAVSSQLDREFEQLLDVIAFSIYGFQLVFSKSDFIDQPFLFAF
ncbi:MAG: hypothetical protein C4534_11295 [Gaiellales bacterium]|nr:MAG: hypothetical protein C4534_11295 [Gaiellales bacterium]